MRRAWRRCRSTRSPQRVARAAFACRLIDNWRVIDDRQLVVYGPGRGEAWHLQLFAPCQGLRFTETLGFRASGTDWICGDPGDAVLLAREPLPDQRGAPGVARAS